MDSIARHERTAAPAARDASRLTTRQRTDGPSRSDTERLIAAGRALLVALSLVAAWAAPGPIPPSRTVWALLLAYAIAAAVLAALGWREGSTAALLRVPAHALDVLFLATLPFLTDPLASPVLAYFAFAIVAATVRWRWSGGLWTAVAMLAAVAVLALAARSLGLPRFGPGPFLAGAAVLIVTAGLLGGLGVLEMRRRELAGVAAGERSRLARDLHDGVLQTLTGAALQLETVPRLWETRPDLARQRLAAIQRLIADEQRNLRVLIRESTLPSVDLSGSDADLSARLHALVRRHVELWDQQVELRVEVAGGTISDAGAADVCRIVHEALANAARHAAASLVRVSVDEADGEVRVVVSDDGHGFSFHGEYDHARLAALRLGPVTLKERVASLGGTLAITSTPAGSRLLIRLPRPRAVA